MSIRRSIAAAVFVAAVSAPTVLGTTQAMAETAPPTPVGQSVPDAEPAETTEATEPAEASETTEATEQAAPPAAPAGSAAAAAPELDEAALRARLADALAEPGHYDYYYKTVEKAQGGTPEQIQHFLDAELARVIQDDNALEAAQVLSAAEPGSPIWEAAQKAFDDGSPGAIESFLKKTLPALIDSDNRVKLSQFAEDPLISAGLRAKALAVLDKGDAEAIAAFLGQAHGALLDDFRIQATQAMAVNGPEVRKVVNQLLTNGTLEELRAFLSKGLAEAQARDRAAAEQENGGTGGNGQQPGDGGTGGNGGNGVTQAALTTTTTTTAANTATTSTDGTGTELAFTGPGTPLTGLTATGAAAVALGAGALVVTRRRRQES